MDAVPLAETNPSLNPVGIVSVICTGALLVLALVLYRRVQGTTLVGPWYWGAAALLAIGGVEGLILLGVLEEGLDAWRFAAAVGVFSPWMSLLGAKRPQDSAWHFIVGSLWGVQAMPAAEVLFLRPGQPLAIIDFRAFFLVVLVGLSLLVYLLTRYWLVGMVLAAGQVVLLSAYLPWSSGAVPDIRIAIACALFLVAALVALAIARRRKDSHSFDRVWRDFRDGFGALWGARVMERVNASAVLYDWPIRLTWSGFHAADDLGRAVEIPPEIQDELHRVLVNLLRRFVSDAWLNARLTPSQR